MLQLQGTPGDPYEGSVEVADMLDYLICKTSHIYVKEKKKGTIFIPSFTWYKGTRKDLDILFKQKMPDSCFGVFFFLVFFSFKTRFIFSK